MDSTPHPSPAKPRRVARSRKTELQLLALDGLETFLVDLVQGGLGGLSAASVESLATQAARMADADLQGLRAILLRLAVLAAPHDDDAVSRRHGHHAGPALEARQAQLSGMVTRLWALLRRGRKVLAGPPDAPDPRAAADAEVETLLGRAWRLPQLQEAGYWTTDRHLLELAHERVEDPVIEQVHTTGWLLDLADGAIHYERSLIPYQALDKPGVHHRTSRRGVLHVREAALYPAAGLNRRIRWSEQDPTAVSEHPRTPADLARVHALARPLEPLLKSCREMLRDPLAAREAVVLLATADIAGVADGPVLIDAAGARLACRDPHDAPCETTGNLRLAAAAYGPGSVAVRLYYDLVDRAIYGQALALLAGERHLRLGM